MDARQNFTSFITMFNDSFPLEFRYIKGDKCKLTKAELANIPWKFSLPLEAIQEDPAVFDRLQHRNSQDLALFLVVNGGGQTDKDIKKVRAHFVDLDSGQLSLADFKTATLVLPPHLIVETSINRFHAYWLVKDGDLERFENIQKGLAAAFQGDPTVSNLSRVMRVPGFVNRKHPLPFAVNISSFNPSDPVSINELVKAYSLESRSEAIHETQTAVTRLNSKDKIPEGERNNTMYRYAVYLYSRDLDDDSAFSLLTKKNAECCQPPLSKNELISIISSAKKSIAHAKAVDDFSGIAQLAESAIDTSIGEPVEPDSIPEDTIKDIAYATAIPDSIMSSDVPANCMVKEVYDYLMESCFETTHELALAGALSYVGALKGHMCRTYTNARTNLFVLALAHSGVGKTEVKNRLFALSHSAAIKNFNIANPASESGLLDSLVISKRRFIAWDEFGLRLKAITKRNNANSYEAGILTFMMEVFSAAGSIFYDRTRRLAVGKKQDTDPSTEIEIPYPHVSVLAISTPESFFSAIGMDRIDDGFIPRFIPVFSPRQEARRIEKQELLSVNMRKYNGLTNRIAAMWAAIDYDINGDTVAGAEPQTKMFSDEAFQIWTEFQYQCRIRKHDRFMPIWLRAAEHAMKVALTISDGGTIGVYQTNWAINFIKNNIQNFLGRAYQNVADSEENITYLRILAFIAECGPEGAARSEVTARFHKYRDWKYMIQSAIDAKAIEVTTLAKSNSKGKAKQMVRITPAGLIKAKQYLESINPTFSMPLNMQPEELPQPVALPQEPASSDFVDEPDDFF